MSSKPSFEGPFAVTFPSSKVWYPSSQWRKWLEHPKKNRCYTNSFIHPPNKIPKTIWSNIWFLRWKKNDISRLCQSLVHDLVAKISYAPPPYGLVPCLRSNNSWIDPRKSHQKNTQTLTGSKHCPEKHGCDQMTLVRVGLVGEKILQKSICSDHPNI